MKENETSNVWKNNVIFSFVKFQRITGSVVNGNSNLFINKKFSKNNSKMKEIILNDHYSLEKRKQILSTKIQKSERILNLFRYTKDAEFVN